MMRKAVEALAAATSLGVCGHVGPDGDALGSAVGFAYCARAAGKDAVVSFGEPFSLNPSLDFMPMDVVVPPKDFPEAPELMVAFDTAAMDRLGSLARSAKAARTLIVVDHHLVNDGFGDIRVIDPTAGAAGQIAYRLVRELGWPVPPEAAIAFWTALVTDTGRFQYSSTSPDLLRAAAELAELGVPIAEIGQRLYERRPFGYLTLASRVLGQAQLDEARSFVWSTMTIGDLEAAGLDYAASDPLIDEVRVAKEAEVTLLVKELADGWRGSLRSRGRVDVAAIAAEFGGGGHHNAAGFTDEGPPEAIVERVRELLDDG